MEEAAPVIRGSKVLFCDNLHGFGDVTYPDLKDMTIDEIEQQLFVDPVTIGWLRAEAKKKGWGRVNRADYCPACMESME
jgi:hypothetical protein